MTHARHFFYKTLKGRGKLIISLPPAVFFACTSTPNNSRLSRSNNEREEIRGSVQAAKIIECRLNSPDWNIPGDVGQAQMLTADGRKALIYEALLRSGPRTVYQRLNADYSFNGDGIAMGLKNAPRTSDLKSVEDIHGNKWFTSRIKINNSELFSGLVEVLIGNRNYRTVLPIPVTESVQQIWISRPVVSNFANVIVRSTQVDDSGLGQEDSSVFRWYQVTAADNSARLSGTFKPRREIFIPAAFIPMENTGEPVAAAVIQPQTGEADAEPAVVSGSSKIVFRRIFGRTAGERIIFEGTGNITGVTVSDSTRYNALHLAWNFAPYQGESRFIQHTSFPVRFIPERYFNRGPLRDAETLWATEISYEANDPDFSFTKNNQNQLMPVLGWWGKLEKDVALLMQVLNPAQRGQRGQQIRLKSGASVGYSFQPSIAIAPPKQFSRILYFSAAPSQTEKSIMILSNRDSSAEIAKESTISSCLF